VLQYATIEPGETVTIPVTYEFLVHDEAYRPYLPGSATPAGFSLGRANTDLRTISFSIHLHKVGLTPGSGNQVVIPGGVHYISGGYRAVTGGEALAMWPFAAAGAVVALGIFAARNLRKHDDEAAKAVAASVTDAAPTRR